MKKWIYYIIGLNMIALAVVLNIRWNLGVAAFSSVMYSASQIYGISLGNASIVMYLIFVLLQCILSKKVTVSYLLEIPLSFAFGWLTDFYDWIVPNVQFPLAANIVLFIVTMFITAMGVFLTVQTNLVLTPVDGIVKTISEVFHIRFSLVKNAYDIAMVAVTVLLCLCNHAPFYGIGIGTILTAVGIGRIISIYEAKIKLSF